jgi:HK97 family phage portal protein
MGWKDKFAGLLSGSYTGGRGSFRADDSDGQQRYSDDSDIFYEASGQKTTAGVKITPEVAMRLSAFFACAKVLAETMASLPFQVYRKLPRDGVEPAPSHPVNELIQYQPNRIQTAVEFWESIILHAVLFGTGYAEILPGARGAVDQLIFIRSDRVSQESLPDGTLRFQVTNPHTGRTKTLLQDEVLRIPGLSFDGINGLRVVDMAAEAIGLGLAADQYASRVFSNNLNMGGFITTQKKMSPDAVRRLVARLMEKYASPANFHRPAVLQDGAKFEPAAMKANEAQLLEARKWQISEIARYLRIPLHMLGVDDQTNRSTVEEQGINFVKYVVRPWARRIEQAVRRDLIIATSIYEARINLDELEKGNLAARKDYYRAALGEGGSQAWLALNEVRVEEGWNRIEEAWADQVQRSVMSQPAAPAVPAPVGEPAAIAPPAPPKLVEDHTPEAIAARVAGKENAALRKASMRFAADPDGMRSFIKAFYGGHVSFVMENLNIPKEGAKAYCAHQRDEALAANDVVALIDCREETLSRSIAAKLREHGV